MVSVYVIFFVSILYLWAALRGIKLLINLQKVLNEHLDSISNSDVSSGVSAGEKNPNRDHAAGFLL